jgi:hypothetical protein
MVRERYSFERYYYWKRARRLARTWQRLNPMPGGDSHAPSR